MLATLPRLENTDFPAIERGKLQTLQVNVGYRCNQQCLHCHVNAGPSRREVLDSATVDCVIEYLRTSGIEAVDITGGAPELNPHFRRLVRAARAMGRRVIDRCNLTVLLEPDQQDLAQFLADEGVEITASMPCYQEGNVDRQRGKGVFDGSIRALRALNALGYGRPGSGRTLNLVYNPQGAALPPPQQALEQAYREHLGGEYNIVFNRLYTLANMPIQRFGSTLISKGQFNDYMELLRGSHNDANLDSVMCRSLISVDWRGYVYDCDFNQMLGLPLRLGAKPRTHLSELVGRDISGLPVVVKDHCYGCTAGQGSSCGGALGD
ncbi:MAG TPA: arsenosugar biosynthesis radical SAM (seleno)protein ArsS [Gammaproteobacteria bacterium]|nr:arsenosugar biosynthesis radical SAM (seleno)protein ArsS [Gammaproteobacteria bacterium]